MAPLTRLRADADHVPVTPLVSSYYTQRCSEPGGLIITEANIISPHHGGDAPPHMPGIWSPAQISAWSDIVASVHAKGCSIYCQLVALGRVSSDHDLAVSSSATPLEASSPDAPPRAMTRDQIRDTVRAFADAARNARAAGFDGVEIHAANGYLVDQFTQDVCNRRDDEYGGSVANRARFGVEVADAVARAIGPKRVGFRISPFSTFQGMKVEDPIAQFGHLVQELKAQDLAYVHMIESRVVNNIDCGKREGLEPLLEIWGSRAPVLVAGGFTPASGTHAVDVEYARYDAAVVYGRHFLSNPDLPFRIRHGLPLNQYDRSSFYTPMSEDGYVDYPFSQEFLQTCRQGARKKA
jgi:2,4-dienoyl-CoA reductase-like NADH-dependent reductase (Old Yellow Enzyme family)